MNERFVLVTTFYNPKLFWMIYEEDLLARQHFCWKLNAYYKFNRIKNYEIGQLVIVEHDNEWVRAELIKIIDNDAPKKELLCWLYDYGIFSMVQDIYYMPEELQICPSYVKKAMMYGMVNVIFEYNTQTGVMEKSRLPYWAPNIRKSVIKMIANTDRLQKFSRHSKHNGFEIGELIHIDEDGKEQNFAEILMIWSLSDYNEEEFQMELVKRKHPKAAVDLMYNVYKSLMRSAPIINTKTPIRNSQGTFWPIAESPGESSSCQAVLPDELFVDAETEEVSSSDTSFKTCSSDNEENNTKSKPICRETIIDNSRSLAIEPTQQHFDQICIQAAEEPVQNTIKDNVNKDALTSLDIIESKENPEAKIEQCFQDKDQYNNNEDVLRYQNDQHEELDHESSTKDANDNFPDKMFRNREIQDNEGLIFQFPSSYFEPGQKFNCHKLFPSSRGRGINIEPAEDTSHRYKGRGLSNFDRDHRVCNRPRVGTDEEYEVGNKVTDPLLVWIKPKVTQPLIKFESNVKPGNLVPFKCYPAGTIISNSRKLNAKDIHNDPKQLPNDEQTSVYRDNPTSTSETWNSVSSQEKNARKQKLYTLLATIKDQRNTYRTQETDKLADAKIAISNSNYEHLEASQEVNNTQGANSSTEEYIHLEDQQLISDTHCGTADEHPVPYYQENKNAVSKNVNPVQDEAINNSGQNNPSVQNSKCFRKIYISYDRETLENLQLYSSMPDNNDRSTEPPNYGYNLFKTDEIYDKLESRYQIYKIDDCFNKLPTPRLLVHGLHAPLPTANFNTLTFGEEIQQKLLQLNCYGPNQLQTYIWPAVLRGQHVIVINDPKTGKTMCYLPAICSFVNLYAEESRDKDGPFGPRAIIFCPTSKIAEQIYKLVNRMLNKRRRAVLLVPPFCDEEVAELEIGVDILICSPRMFLRVFEAGLIHLQRVGHIIIENANDILEVFTPDMEVIFDLLQGSLHSVSEPMQLIVISEEYTIAIELLAHKLLRIPLICIGSYLEAAFYGQAETCLKFTGRVLKQYQVIELISDQARQCKTVIISNDMDESTLMIQYLNTHGYYYLWLNESSTENDIESAKRTWAQSITGRYPVLVCTNTILQDSLAIDDAALVIQLDIPTYWDELMYLYSSFTDNYSSPLLTTIEERNLRLRAFIFLDENNLNLVPRLILSLLKKGENLTPKVLDAFTEMIFNIEMEKLRSDVKICESVKIFGVCKTRISCQYRHILSVEVDLPKSLPVYNYVKLDILYVRDVTSFYARLIEYKDYSGEIHKACDRNAEIAEWLEELTNSATRTVAFDVKIGSIAAVEEETNIFRRCEVVHLEKTGILNQAIEVLVHMIDTGADMRVAANKLYMIPEELKRIPPQVTEVYIAGMAPPDFDENWSQLCFYQVQHKISICHPRFTGKVLVQLGNTIFVNNLYQKNVPHNELSVPSVKDYLMREQLVDENPNNLKRLYELCDKYGIPVPLSRMPHINPE